MTVAAVFSCGHCISVLSCFYFVLYFVAEKVVSNLLASRPKYLCKCFLFTSLVCRVNGIVSECQLSYLGLGSHPCVQSWKVCTVFFSWSQFPVLCTVFAFFKTWSVDNSCYEPMCLCQCTTVLFGPTWVSLPNGISIGSAILAQPPHVPNT